MSKQKSKRPYFIWDYDLSEDDVKRILKEGNKLTRQWLIARILEKAHFKDVFRYLTLKQVVTNFPKLRMHPVMRKYWKRALTSWGYCV